jgi:hypothetical protein
MSNIYPYSVFYFTKSVYDEAGKKQNPTQENHAFKLILKSVLMNIRFKDKIGTHVTFTTQDILNSVKDEEYAKNFKGLVQLGKNIAYPEESEDISGDKDFKLIQFAVNKDGDVLGLIKIVVEDYETRQALKKIIDEKNYLLTLVSCEEALNELEVIEKKLFEMFS